MILTPVSTSKQKRLGYLRGQAQPLTNQDTINLLFSEMEAILVTILIICLAFIYVRKYLDINKIPKNVETKGSSSTSVNSEKSDNAKASVMITILYATQTGTSKEFATKLSNKIRKCGLKVDLSISNLKNYAFDDLCEEQYVILLIPTWTGGTHVEDAKVFATAVNEATHDFRIEKKHLSKVNLRYVDRKGIFIVSYRVKLTLSFYFFKKFFWIFSIVCSVWVTLNMMIISVKLLRIY